MKREHFNHVMNHFDLKIHHSIWRSEYEQINPTQLYVIQISDHWIIDQGGVRYIFMRFLYSHEFALSIIQYIKDTEILFV